MNLRKFSLSVLVPTLVVVALATAAAYVFRAPLSMAVATQVVAGRLAADAR